MKDNYLKKQAKWLSEGQIDRRQFVMSAIAAGLAIPTALSLADNVLAATPNKGGRLRFGSLYGSTTDVLDAGTSENGMSQAILYARGNHLTEIGQDGKLRGELAESFEPSNGAKTWAFNLRKGVEFHNGKSLTAQDVIATYNYHRGENSKSAAKGLLSAITDIKADGDNRVIFELSGGNADFPYIVSDYHIMIMHSNAEGSIDDPNSPIGTGGYVVENYNPGTSTTFKRNPNYFKENSAFFDEVEMLTLADTTARQNALMNGDVDYIDNVDAKTVALLGRNPNVEILKTTGTQHYTFPMRVDAAPFDNYDLRMALKYAIKRQELVDKILLGNGEAGNDVPVNASMPFLNTELPKHEFDAEKAAMHYKKSGHSGKIQLSVSDAAFAGAVDAAQLIAASAKEAGIDIEIVREPKDGYWSNVWNKKPWSACYWGGRPTQDWMYSAAYTNDTEWNDTAWKSGEQADKFNSLVVAARSETNDATRKDQYWEAQALLQEHGGAIVAMWASFIQGHSKKLAHGEEVAANWVNDGNKMAERWWFA
ncbi:MAG: ABC transporter substrate-binding protein [Rhizobiaceae bacterium]